MPNGQFKIGATLAVDGEKEFKKALAEANKELKLLSSEAKASSAAFENNGDEMANLTKQYEIASDKVAVQREKVIALQKAMEDLAKTEGEDSEKVKDYAIQLNNASAQLDKMTAEEQKSKAALDDYTKAHSGVKGAVNEAKEALSKFAEAHPKATKAMEAGLAAAKKLGEVGLKAIEVGAKASVAAIGAVAAGAVAMGKAVYDSAKEASEYGDQVDKASQKMGVTAETYQQLSYAADLAGTSMGTLQKATVALQKSGSDLNIDEALESILAIPDADERAAKAHEMFGDKIANELAPLLNAGKDAFDESKQAALDYGLVMSDEAVKASAAFNDTLTTMTSTMDMVKNNIAADFLPGINTVMEGITGVFTGKDGAPEQIEQGVTEILEGLETALPKVINVFTNLANTLIEIAPEILGGLSQGLIDNLNVMIDAAMEIVNALMEGLFTPENIEAITDGAVNLLTNLVEFLSKNAPLMIDAALTLVTTLMESFLEGDNLQELIHGTIDMIGEIVSVLIENAPMLIEAAFEMAKALAEAIIDYDWLGLAKKIFNSIKDAIKGFFTGGEDSKSGSRSRGHAGGISYVPTNDYLAQLHEGERVLTAAEAENERVNSDYEMLNAKLDMVIAQQGAETPVNINISGSAGALIRALNIEVDREAKRKSAFAS